MAKKSEVTLAHGGAEAKTFYRKGVNWVSEQR
jgi:hypothetical protein